MDWKLAVVAVASVARVLFCEDFCVSQSGDPAEECAGELSCYGCTVPVLNLEQSLREKFSGCIHSETDGGHLAKCYKSDSRACAIVKIYNNDPVKPCHPLPRFVATAIK